MRRGGVSHPAGHRVHWLSDAARDRPVRVDAWYPADPGTSEAPHVYGLSAGSVAEAAAPAFAPGGRPAVVLSHGAFGTADNYSWLAEHLARSGYVVAGVSHFREPPGYGPRTIDPAAALQPWLRLEDCAFVLDNLAGLADVGPTIDRARIGAVGHSSGGAAYDAAAMAAYCASDAAGDDRGCAYARQHAQASGSPPQLVAPWGRDGRVRAIVALDPALGPGHTDASLVAMAVPVLLAGAVDNDFLPFDAHAGRYARLIPGAELVPLAGGEGHFVYVDTCGAEIDVNGVPLCRDRPGVDRAAVHARLAVEVGAFLDRHLGGPDSP